MEQTLIQRAVFWFFLALFCISVLLLGKLVTPFIATIVIGGVLTGVFQPVFNRFAEKVSHRTASIVTCIVIFFVVFIPVVLFVAVLSKEAGDIALE